jgi:hypothetical protein
LADARSDLAEVELQRRGATGNCVELALGALRDSKHPDGSVLSVDVTALVAAVKAGQIGWPTTSALPEPIAIVM